MQHFLYQYFWVRYLGSMTKFVWYWGISLLMFHIDSKWKTEEQNCWLYSSFLLLFFPFQSLITGLHLNRLIIFLQMLLPLAVATCWPFLMMSFRRCVSLYVLLGWKRNSLWEMAILTRYDLKHILEFWKEHRLKSVYI